MLETIAKGRLEVRRPAAGQPQAKAKPDATTASDQLEDMLDAERAAQIGDQVMLERQREAFDFATAERAELDREYNNTRDLILAQMKADDEVVKKYIAMI